MLGSAIPLTYLVQVGGAAQGQAAIRGLTSEMDRSRSIFGRPLSLSGWLTPLAGVRSALSGIGRMAAGVAGGMGLGFGVAGFTKLLRESSTFNEDLISLQAALGETDDEIERVRGRMEDLAVSTGRGRTELLAMARAGTDFGLSLAEAVDGMEDFDALARAMKVDPTNLMRGAGGLRKLAGEEMDPQMLRTMLWEGQQASGMPEDVFLEMVGRVAPQLSGIQGLEGQEGVSFLMEQLAALGETMATNPKKFRGGLEELIRTIRDPKYRETFESLGIDMNDLSKAQMQLVMHTLAGTKELEKLPQGLRDFLLEIGQSEGALERLEGAHNTLTGDLTEQSAELQKHLERIKNEPTWDKLMERFKRPLLEAADKVFSWAVSHMPQIKAAFQTLGVMVGWVFEKLVAFGGALVSAWKWIRDNIGEPVAEAVHDTWEGFKDQTDPNKPQPWYGGSFFSTVAERARQIEGDEEAQQNVDAIMGAEGIGGLVRLWGEHLAQQPAPVVNVTVDPRVDAEAEVRATEAAGTTMPGPNGVAP